MTRWARGGGAWGDLKVLARFFLGLVVIGYVVLRLIVYLTRVLAQYFMHGTWNFF